jgi:hypothetical protein
MGAMRGSVLPGNILYASPYGPRRSNITFVQVELHYRKK